MLPIIKKEDKISLLAEDKVKEIKIKEQTIELSQENKKEINQAFLEGIKNIARSVSKFLKYNVDENNNVDMVVIHTDGDPAEFVVNRYADSLSHIALNVIPEDVPEQITDMVNGNPDPLSDIVVSCPVRSSANVNGKDVLNSYYSRSVLSGFLNLSKNYNYNVSDFYHSGDVKKACILFEELDSCYLIPSDTVKIEFGVNNDFRNASSKHKYLGDFNGAGRLDRGANYRTDQNAWKDIVFSYYSVDKTNSIVSIPLPFNLDTENMLSKYSALSLLYKKYPNVSRYMLNTVLDVDALISINYVLNIGSYFFANMYDMNSANINDEAISKFIKGADKSYKSRRGTSKNFDPVINDDGFMYFEADNPLWRGTIYWPGCFVRNLAVYGSPFHLEIGSTRSSFALARYVTHNYLKAMGNILGDISIPVKGYDLILKSESSYFDIFHLRSSNFDYDGITLNRNLTDNNIGKLNKMLLYAIAINSMTKQCVKQGQPYYASHYLRDNYLTKDLINLINKNNNILSLIFGINYKIQETDYSREINHMYSPHAAALLDLAVEKYWETVDQNEKLLQEGHPVFNA
ncbi:MAG: hypothetical protein QXF12_04370 [Candidatus Aenigmatarchaeota archaeon]